MFNSIGHLKEAAEQGDKVAQYTLGFCYSKGERVPQNQKKAFKWYQKSACQGHADAQHNTGACFFRGIGVEQNYEKAFKWYRKAADQGYADAQHCVGVCYSDGLGVAQNDKKALQWYQKAAKQGLANSQHNLAIFYENTMDLKKAKRLYKLAAKQGFAPSHAALARLEAGSGADVQKVQKHIRKAKAGMAAIAPENRQKQYFDELRSASQYLLEDDKLVSLLRCGNEGCSVAYSGEASVQTVQLKSCARCRRVSYCSVDCQTADWKARHKFECEPPSVQVGESSGAKQS